MTSTLDLRELTKRYAAFELGPLSLSFAPGRVHGLLGPNGAGKTTLLSLITLQTRPTSGALAYAGVPIVWGDARWKERVAYVRETPSFYAELTVDETMRLAGRLYGRWDAGLAARMMTRLGLRGGQVVRTLSKGTRVKLGIAAALAQRAEVLILDEPTAGVDPTAREELYEILGDLRRERPDLCVVLSSHIFEDIDALADEVLVLRDGRAVFRASQAELRAMTLYRMPAPVDPALTREAALTWTSNGSRWVMAHAGSPIVPQLQAVPGCAEETQGSMLAAVYRGTGARLTEEAR